MFLIHQYSKEVYQDKFYEVPWALSWHIFGNYRCIFKYLSQCSMYFNNKFWLCVEKEGVICVCCIYIPKTYMTLTPLIKITVVLCGRFEFIFYSMQLLHFKWISRYEKTNAYILIIYLFCINIYNEIHTFIFITFSSTSHIQPLAVKNWLKSMMKRNCVHSTKRGWHQKCQLTVLEMNGRYDDFTNKDRDIIWKLEPLACYFCFTFWEIIFL